MKNILLLLSAITIFTASTVCGVHASVGTQVVGQQLDYQQLELSIDQDNNTTDRKSTSNSSDSLCDMHCHHIASTNLTQKAILNTSNELTHVVSEDSPYSFIYGLKRPPKF